MGNCCGCGASHVAKETFHPVGDGTDFSTAVINTADLSIDESKAEEMKNNVPPLKINMDDKLKMEVEETGLEFPKGTVLWKMKNQSTGGNSGLIPSNLVGKAGSIEVEK